LNVRSKLENLTTARNARSARDRMECSRMQPGSVKSVTMLNRVSFTHVSKSTNASTRQATSFMSTRLPLSG
jgi:hypothetical protein